MADHKRLTNASLILIDDVILFPVEKSQAVNLFNFINQLYENTSFIITTNKVPSDWAKCWTMRCWQPLFWTGYSSAVK
jgi:DNA replication protein DnaC